jgi:hypothetical protein
VGAGVKRCAATAVCLTRGACPAAPLLRAHTVDALLRRRGPALQQRPCLRPTTPLRTCAGRAWTPRKVGRCAVWCGCRAALCTASQSRSSAPHPAPPPTVLTARAAVLCRVWPAAERQRQEEMLKSRQLVLAQQAKSAGQLANRAQREVRRAAAAAAVRRACGRGRGRPCGAAGLPCSAAGGSFLFPFFLFSASFFLPQVSVYHTHATPTHARARAHAHARAHTHTHTHTHTHSANGVQLYIGGLAQGQVTDSMLAQVFNSALIAAFPEAGAAGHEPVSRVSNQRVAEQQSARACGCCGWLCVCVCVCVCRVFGSWIAQVLLRRHANIHRNPVRRGHQHHTHTRARAHAHTRTGPHPHGRPLRLCRVSHPRVRERCAGAQRAGVCARACAATGRHAAAQRECSASAAQASVFRALLCEHSSRAWCAHTHLPTYPATFNTHAHTRSLAHRST